MPLSTEGAAHLTLSTAAKCLEHTVVDLGFFTVRQIFRVNCFFAADAFQVLETLIIWHCPVMAFSGIQVPARALV